VTYVDNIRRYYDALVWLDENNAIAPITSTNETEEKIVKPDDSEQRTSNAAEEKK